MLKLINIYGVAKGFYTLCYLLFYITYNNMQKNCKMLPNKINKWKIEWEYLCFLPILYIIAPIVYAIPPDNNNINPFAVKAFGNIYALNIMHHPIAK